MHNIWTLDLVDISDLEKLLLSDGELNILPAKKLLQFSISHIQTFCVKHGIYHIPTQELIEWLKPHIECKKAIEICGGKNGLGKALGIPSTDSYMQTRPEMVAYYKSLRQTPITPPSHVLKFDANSAVTHFKPEVVIGSFVTQLWTPGDSTGSEEGTDEIAILSQVKKYIHIGNENTHNYKRLMQVPHEVYHYDWLISRAKDQTLNRIWVWKRD